MCVKLFTYPICSSKNFYVFFSSLAIFFFTFNTRTADTSPVPSQRFEDYFALSTRLNSNTGTESLYAFFLLMDYQNKNKELQTKKQEYLESLTFTSELQRASNTAFFNLSALTDLQSDLLAQSENPIDLFNAGVRHLKNGNSQNALALFAPVPFQEAHYCSALALHELARQSTELKDYKTALNYLQRSKDECTLIAACSHPVLQTLITKINRDYQTINDYISSRHSQDDRPKGVPLSATPVEEATRDTSDRTKALLNKARFQEIISQIDSSSQKTILRQLFNLMNDLSEPSDDNKDLNKSTVVEHILTVMKKNRSIEHYGLERFSEIHPTNSGFAQNLAQALSSYEIQEPDNKKKHVLLCIKKINRALQLMEDAGNKAHISLLQELYTLHKYHEDHEKCVKIGEKLFSLDKNNLKKYIKALIKSIQKNTSKNVQQERIRLIDTLMSQLPAETPNDAFTISHLKVARHLISPESSSILTDNAMCDHIKLSLEQGFIPKYNLIPMERLLALVEKKGIDHEVLSSIIRIVIQFYQDIQDSSSIGTFNKEEITAIKKAYTLAQKKIPTLVASGGILALHNALTQESNHNKQIDLIERIIIQLKEDKNALFRPGMLRYIAHFFSIHPNPINILHTFATYSIKDKTVVQKLRSLPQLHFPTYVDPEKLAAVKKFFFEAFVENPDDVFFDIYSFILMVDSQEKEKEALCCDIEKGDKTTIENNFITIKKNIDILSDKLRFTPTENTVAHFVSCVERWAHVGRLIKKDRKIITAINTHLEILARSRKKSLPVKTVDAHEKKLLCLKHLIIASSDQFHVDEQKKAQATALGMLLQDQEIMTISDVFTLSLINKIIPAHYKTVGNSNLPELFDKTQPPTLVETKQSDIPTKAHKKALKKQEEPAVVTMTSRNNHQAAMPLISPYESMLEEIKNNRENQGYLKNAIKSVLNDFQTKKEMTLPEQHSLLNAIFNHLNPNSLSKGECRNIRPALEAMSCDSSLSPLQQGCFLLMIGKVLRDDQILKKSIAVLKDRTEHEAVIARASAGVHIILHLGQDPTYPKDRILKKLIELEKDESKAQDFLIDTITTFIMKNKDKLQDKEKLPVQKITDYFEQHSGGNALILQALMAASRMFPTMNTYTLKYGELALSQTTDPEEKNKIRRDLLDISTDLNKQIEHLLALTTVESKIIIDAIDKLGTRKLPGDEIRARQLIDRLADTTEQEKFDKLMCKIAFECNINGNYDIADLIEEFLSHAINTDQLSALTNIKLLPAIEIVFNRTSNSNIKAFAGFTIIEISENSDKKAIIEQTIQSIVPTHTNMLKFLFKRAENPQAICFYGSHLLERIKSDPTVGSTALLRDMLEHAEKSSGYLLNLVEYIAQNYQKYNDLFTSSLYTTLQQMSFNREQITLESLESISTLFEKELARKNLAQDAQPKISNWIALMRVMMIRLLKKQSNPENESIILEKITSLKENLENLFYKNETLFTILACLDLWKIQLIWCEFLRKNNQDYKMKDKIERVIKLFESLSRYFKKESEGRDLIESRIENLILLKNLMYATTLDNRLSMERRRAKKEFEKIKIIGIGGTFIEDLCKQAGIFKE